MPTISYIQNPTLPSFESWACQLRIDLRTYNIPKVGIQTNNVYYNVNNWWEWASELILSNNLDSTIPLPTRLSYPNKNDWKKWVLFVVSSTSLFAIS
jgi:hypothetical protein